MQSTCMNARKHKLRRYIVRYQTNLSTICVAPGCRIVRSILVSEEGRRQSQLAVQSLHCPSISRSRFLFFCLFLSFCLMANDRQRNKYKQTMHREKYKLFVYTIYKDNSNTAKKHAQILEYIRVRNDLCPAQIHRYMHAYLLSKWCVRSLTSGSVSPLMSTPSIFNIAQPGSNPAMWAVVLCCMWYVCARARYPYIIRDFWQCSSVNRPLSLKIFLQFCI